ncbi:hypothetical protein GCM10010515_59570 [Streptomyces fructofermentans]|uniref:Uncharacterized protein n=1 Tax=Streptomyces fructofermentans TaxID=152141 RepID=A0A918U2F2_9ACTN|nr:hypothetical protein GCM10010515_59570 [Streptomyces fructofermentans]
MERAAARGVCMDPDRATGGRVWAVGRIAEGAVCGPVLVWIRLPLIGNWSQDSPMEPSRAAWEGHHGSVTGTTWVGAHVVRLAGLSACTSRAKLRVRPDRVGSGGGEPGP